MVIKFPIELSLMAMRRWDSIFQLTVFMEPEVIATESFDECPDIHPYAFIANHSYAGTNDDVHLRSRSIKATYSYSDNQELHQSHQDYDQVKGLKTKKSKLKIKDPRSQDTQKNYEGMPTTTRFQDYDINEEESSVQ
ncbi:hypothetical protein Tco_1151279 [Tanacetum coccineum]